METRQILKKLEGIHTINSVMRTLNEDKNKATYHIHVLRKHGYVKTRKMSNHKRIYHISFQNKLRGSSYYDIINKYAPVKISPPSIFKIYGKEPTIEETLIFAIKTKSIRIILASLELFQHITDWSSLYRLSKANHIERQVGALYDVARTIIRVRKMPKRFQNNALPKKVYEFRYAVPGLKSKDFKEIENKWKIRIPLNKKDIEVYK